MSGLNAAAILRKLMHIILEIIKQLLDEFCLIYHLR